MTQALINNLNTIQDTNLATQPKSNSDENFEKVYNQCVSSEEHSVSEKDSIKSDKDNTLGVLKKKSSNNTNELKAVQEPTSKEIVVEAVLDIGLIKDLDNININGKDSVADDMISEIINDTENLSNDIMENSEEITNDEINLSISNINTPISSIVTNQMLQCDNQEHTALQDCEEFKVQIDGIDIKNLSDEFTPNNAEQDSIVTQSSDIKEDKGVKLQDIIEEDKLKELNIEKIDTSLSSDNEGAESDLMQNQTPQEQGVKAMLHTNTEFQNTKVENAIKTQPSNTSQPVNSTEKVIEQISKQLSNLHNTSRVNIVLNPESLGKVSLQIINNLDGLSAQFTVATQEARDLIMKGLEGLKESLLSQGVNVDNVSVKLNDIQKSEYNQDWTEQEGSRGGNKNQKEHHRNEKEKEFEKMMFGLTQEDELA